MTMKQAICNVAHPGSLESLQMMLSTIGYECMILGSDLQDQIKTAGCDTVHSVLPFAERWGWDLQHSYKVAHVADINRRDVIYIDVKAHRSYYKIVDRWPHLKDKVLWYFINGGEPKNYRDVGKGDETNPPCPVLTPDQWYKQLHLSHLQSYVMWPPFRDTNRIVERSDAPTGDPICVVHNLEGWGYGDILPLRESIGLKCYGGYGSPDGLLPHREMFDKLSQAVCMVHLKSVDAPGYAVYEAMLTGCPVVLPERFIHRCYAYDLFVPGETCLTFDRYNEPASINPVESMAQIATAVSALRDPAFNRRIGEAGRSRLQSLLWSAEREVDVQSLKTFFERCFG